MDKRPDPGEAGSPAPHGIPYLPHTPADIARMLEVIGAASLDDLFRQVPASLRASGRIDLPGPLPEPQVRRRLEALAAQNLSTNSLCFAGAGVYPHEVPEVVNSLLRRGEFATAYTPYQPEVSQGTLQATFEFQSLVAMLFGLDVANASMYDAASAAAEAVLMARRIAPGRVGIWVSRAVHPHIRRVIRTYTTGLETAYRELPIGTDGRTDLTPLTRDGAARASSVVLGYPNVFGILDDVPAAAALVRAQDAVLITVTAEPLALGVCQAPGTLGADVAVGEGQSLGLPMSYGGPGVGLFAIRERHVRHMPGRVVGATVDRDGRRGYVLTLAAREQHIRRERATSNICTNQTLCAVGVAIYLSLLGRRGLRDLADLNYRRAHAAAARLEGAGFPLRFAGPFFNEFVVQVPEAETRWKRAAERGILAGVPLAPWYPDLRDCLLLAVTEMHAPEDVERLAVALEKGA